MHTDNDLDFGDYQDLNLIILLMIQKLGKDEVNGMHSAMCQFGLSPKTIQAVVRLSVGDLKQVVVKFGNNFMFASKKADDTIYQLIRSGVAADDVFIIAKLRSLAAEKILGSRQ